MPRYFFHTADGVRDPDTDGIEFEDDDAAQLEAVRYAGEALRWQPKKLWKRGQWRVEVTGEDGALLFTVITVAVDAPKRDLVAGVGTANDRA
jgi:hypothetical protein